MPRNILRAVAVLAAAALILTCPGLGAYSASAQAFSRTTGVGSVELGVRPVSAVGGWGGLAPGSALSGGLGLDLGGTLAAAPSIGLAAGALRLGSDLQAATGLRAGSLSISGIAQGASLSAPRRSEALTDSPSVFQAMSGDVRQLSAGVRDVLESPRAAPGAPLSSAYGSAFALQSAVTSERLGARGSIEVGDAYGIAGNRYWASPAGAGVAAAVQSGYTGEARPAVPLPQPPSPEAPVSRSSLLSLVPRIAAVVVFLTPLYLIALPLLQAGGTLAFVAGAAVAASSAANALMPWMGKWTPAAIRTLPGAVLMGLGIVTAAAAAFVPFSWTAVAAHAGAAAFTTLSGWSLYDVAREGRDRPRDSKEILTTFVGAAGAVAGAGLALQAALGGAALSLPLVAAFPIALALLAGTSGANWAGAGARTMAEAAIKGVAGVAAVFTSIDYDTLRRRRLDAFRDAALTADAWNAVWLSLRYVPVRIAGTIQTAASAVVGAWTAAFQAPVFFLWGAAHQISPESGATRFLARWARFSFSAVQGSKASVFDDMQRPWIEWANSERPLKSLAGAAAIRVMQFSWAMYAVVLAPITVFTGFFRAFAGAGERYDAARHSPASLESPEPRYTARPVSAREPASYSVYKGLAFAVAMLPAVFFAWPVFVASVATAGGTITWAALAYPYLAILIGIMPLMPGVKDQSSFSRFMRRAPGLALALTGAVMAATGFGAALGGLAILGGLAAARYAGRLNDGDVKEPPTAVGRALRWVSDVGVVPSAIVLTSALGAALVGATGTAAAILGYAAIATAPFAAAHAPMFLLNGAKSLGAGISYSVRGIHRVLNFWQKETAFDRNLDAGREHWLKKSRMNGSWLWVGWTPMQAVKLIEWVAAIAAALAMFDALSLLSLAGIDLAAAVLPIVNAIPYGAQLAGGLGTVLSSSAFQISVAGFLVTTLGLRAASLFLWGAAYELAPKSRVTRFLAGFTRSLLEQSEGSKKGSFDSTVSSFGEMMNRSSAATGAPTLGARVGFYGARMMQSVWLPRMVIMLPINMVKALIDGIANATEAREPNADAAKDDPMLVLSRAGGS
ncbi:MAG: hypothetical protein HY078_15475 [Elusimicrobia bacterium]|nr:hypothetical protein [Elusimicrobiota bacterium]